jgi:cytochrome c-type biogenesis protein CcmH
MSARRSTTSGALLVAAVLVAVVALSATALGGRADPPTTAQQADDIASSLHCPVCKDLSAADSPAPLARQMRQQIRQQLSAGATPAQIRQGFVAAYGPTVLMSPPNHGWGRAAHLAPLVLLAVAALAGACTVRRGLRSQVISTRTSTGIPDPDPAIERPGALPPAARRRVEQALAQLRQEEP